MISNGIDDKYLSLLENVIEYGAVKQTRNGPVRSLFGETLTFYFKGDNFPLLTTKKLNYDTILTELIWFIKGRTDLRFLLDNNCNIWNGDAYERYKRAVHEGGWDATWCEVTPYSIEEFIELIKTDDDFNDEFGDLGTIYGYQWRNSNSIDQLKGAIDLIKYNPDSRRILVSAWNVSELDEMLLPPCHYSFQFYCGFEKDGSRNLSMIVNMRSVDVPLGLPFNIASYATLLKLIAKIVNMKCHKMIFNLGDVHVYENQVEAVKKQIYREPYKLPDLIISDEVTKDFDIDNVSKELFTLKNYNSHPFIKIPLSN